MPYIFPLVTWTILYFMIILKLPILYIGTVIYYAIKVGPPNPLEPAGLEQEPLPSPWKPWQQYKYNRRRPRPSHGGPDRRATRGSRAVTQRTHAK